MIEANILTAVGIGSAAIGFITGFLACYFSVPPRKEIVTESGFGTYVAFSSIGTELSHTKSSNPSTSWAILMKTRQVDLKELKRLGYIVKKIG